MFIKVMDDLFDELGGDFESIQECLEYYAQELDTTEDRLLVTYVEFSPEEKESVFKEIQTLPHFKDKKIYSLELGVTVPVDGIVQLDRLLIKNNPLAMSMALKDNPHVILYEK